MDDAQQLTLGVFRLEFGNLCQDPFRGMVNETGSVFYDVVS
jgi:hypothetical protein